MVKGIRAFFKPATVGKGGKLAPKRQTSPLPADGGPAAAVTAAAAPAAADTPPSAPVPPAPMLQFTRKRKRNSSDDEAALAAAFPKGESSVGPGLLEAAADPVAAPLPASGTAAVGSKAATRHLTQMHLDVGQRDFHTYRCPTCGMLYARGTDADERLHAAFHASALQGPRYLGWQGERVAAVDGSRGRVLLFSTADQGRGRKPLLELSRFLEEQMGLAQGWLLQVPLTLLLYVSRTRRIQACVAAEGIKEAFHVQPSLPPSIQHAVRSCGSAVAAGSGDGGSQTPAVAPAVLPAVTAAHVATSGHSMLSETRSSGSAVAAAATADCGRGGMDDCRSAPAPLGSDAAEQKEEQQEEQQQSAVPQVDHQHQDPPPAAAAAAGHAAAASTAATHAAACAAAPLVLDRRQRVRAVCGVRMMWVSLDARRQGLATRLLDCCRCHFMPGYVLLRHELAFSAPTDAGRAFIEVYTGSRRFLVYE